MSDDEKQDGPSRRTVLAAGAALAASALLGCEDSAPAGATAETLDGGVNPTPNPPKDGSQGLEAMDEGVEPGEPDAAPSSDAGAPDPSDEGPANPVDAADQDASPQIDAGEGAEPVDATADDAAVGPDPTVWLTDLPLSDAFPLGIASGDAATDQAYVWARYGGDAVLTLVVWRPRLIHGIYATDQDPAGFAHVQVTELEAGAYYQYAFVEYVDDRPIARSELGGLRAAIPLDARLPVVFGAISCTNQLFDLAPVARAAQHDFDLFLQLGDTTYADGASTPDEYREKWAENLGEDPYRALRRRTSLLATWDDHEVGNNWTPENTDAQAIAIGRAAFFEHMPIGRNPMDPERIWRSFRWGRTAEFFVLDSRGERRPSTRFTPDAQYLSPTQFDWLVAGLRDSPAVFKIVVNSVPIGEFPYPSTNDRWVGYPAQREALLSIIDLEEIEGVVFVSGDFHHASAGRVAADGPGSQIPEFLVGPGGQVPNPLHLALPALPQFDWATGVNNYARFALDPVTRTMSVTYHSATDRLLYETVHAL